MNFEEQARYAAEVAARELETAHGEILEAWFERESGERTPVLESGQPASFAARVRFDGPVEDPEFTVILRNSGDLMMFAATSYWTSAETGSFAAGDEAVMRVRFENILAPDRYRATIGIALPGGKSEWVLRKENVSEVQVTSVRRSGALVDIPYEVELA